MKKKNMRLVALFVCVLLLGIGYATISDTITMDITANISAADLKLGWVGIDESSDLFDDEFTATLTGNDETKVFSGEFQDAVKSTKDKYVGVDVNAYSDATLSIELNSSTMWIADEPYSSTYGNGYILMIDFANFSPDLKATNVTTTLTASGDNKDLCSTLLAVVNNGTTLSLDSTGKTSEYLLPAINGMLEPAYSYQDFTSDVMGYTEFRIGLLHQPDEAVSCTYDLSISGDAVVNYTK